MEEEGFDILDAFTNLNDMDVDLIVPSSQSNVESQGPDFQSEAVIDQYVNQSTLETTPHVELGNSVQQSSANDSNEDQEDFATTDQARMDMLGALPAELAVPHPVALSEHQEERQSLTERILDSLIYDEGDTPPRLTQNQGDSSPESSCWNELADTVVPPSVNPELSSANIDPQLLDLMNPDPLDIDFPEFNLSNPNLESSSHATSFLNHQAQPPGAGMPQEYSASAYGIDNNEFVFTGNGPAMMPQTNDMLFSERQIADIAQYLDPQELQVFHGLLMQAELRRHQANYPFDTTQLQLDYHSHTAQQQPYHQATGGQQQPLDQFNTTLQQSYYQGPDEQQQQQQHQHQQQQQQLKHQSNHSSLQENNQANAHGEVNDDSDEESTLKNWRNNLYPISYRRKLVAANDKRTKADGRYRTHKNYPPWGRIQANGHHQFAYKSNGELSPTPSSLSYDDLHLYTEQCPRPLKIWVQKIPAQCVYRTQGLNLNCRWSQCPNRGKILHGWFRVVFDERALGTTSGRYDPFIYAFSMHLWCFEQVFDPMQFIARGALDLDVRRLEQEERNPMHADETSRREIESVLKQWIQSNRNRYSLQGLSPRPPPYETTLSHALHEFRLGHQIPARQETRSRRNADKGADEQNSVDVHRGDLEQFVRTKDRVNDARRNIGRGDSDQKHEARLALRAGERIEGEQRMLERALASAQQLQQLPQQQVSLVETGMLQGSAQLTLPFSRHGQAQNSSMHDLTGGPLTPSGAAFELPVRSSQRPRRQKRHREEVGHDSEAENSPTQARRFSKRRRAP